MGLVQRSVILRPIAQLAVLLSALLMSGCDNLENILLFKSVGDPDLFESDVDPAVAQNTVDIEVDTSEQMVLDTLRASLFAHQSLPIHKYWDSKGLNDYMISDGHFEVPCVEGGNFTLDLIRRDAEVFTVGDTASIIYSDCQMADGSVINGEMNGRFIEVEGWNKTFSAVTTDYCVEQVQDSEDNLGETIYFSADLFRYRERGDVVVIEVIDRVGEESGSAIGFEVKEEIEIPKGVTNIIVHQPNDPNITELTSIGGDEVYTIRDNVGTEGPLLIQCQAYAKGIEVRVDNLSAVKSEITTTLNGIVDIFELTHDFNLISYEVRDSDFTVTVEEGASEKGFLFDNTDMTQICNLDTGAYTFEVDGAIYSESYVNVDDGVRKGGNSIVVRTNTSLSGVEGSAPRLGNLVLLGQGVERINLTAEQSEVKISVDWDGLEEFEGISRADVTFNTRWDDLFQGNYSQADFVAE